MFLFVSCGEEKFKPLQVGLLLDLQSQAVISEGARVRESSEITHLDTGEFVDDVLSRLSSECCSG